MLIHRPRMGRFMKRARTRAPGCHATHPTWIPAQHRLHNCPWHSIKCWIDMLRKWNISSVTIYRMPVDSKMRSRAPRTGKRFKIKLETIATQQADLLQRVRARDGLSRVQLARCLNLAPSTVGIYVDHLVEEGYLFEGKGVERDFGRPPTILALNPQGGRFIDRKSTRLNS